MQNTLQNFFSECNAFCGTENTLHALFVHHLIQQDVDHRRIAREHRVGKGRVDIALWNTPNCSGSPQLAIEFKGGAYGNRNALSDTIGPDGCCTDLIKLQPPADAGMECWFICVDMRSLGVALNERAREMVAHQAAQRGINFAYYCQGDDTFLMGQKSGIKKMPVSVHYAPGKCTTFSIAGEDSWISGASRLVKGLNDSEATYASLLYNALRSQGYGANQLSLETYFKCASVNDSRMQLRPDLVVFHPDVDGHFNLYRKGDSRKCNDQQKIANLLAVIEVKGSTSTSKISAIKFAEQIAADLGKLAAWRKMLTTAHPNGRAKDALYGLVALDHCARLSGELLTSLRQQAKSMNVELVHMEV